MSSTRRAAARLRPRKRHAALLLALAGVGGLTAASAATLSVAATSHDVAAGSATVASCDTSVTTELTGYTYDTSAKAFAAGSVALSSVADECAGKSVSLAVLDSSGAIVANGHGTVGASGSTATSIPLSALADPARATTIRVVIS